MLVRALVVWCAVSVPISVIMGLCMRDRRHLPRSCIRPDDRPRRYDASQAQPRWALVTLNPIAAPGKRPSSRRV